MKMSRCFDEKYYRLYDADFLGIAKKLICFWARLFKTNDVVS